MGMDEKRQRGQLYADSLKEFLIRYRLLYVDLHSALTLVGNHSTSKHRSAAVKTKKEKEETGKTKEPCVLCDGQHQIWQCAGELKKIAAGLRTLPSQVCAACLNIKKTGHPSQCSIVRSKQKGVFYLYQNRCPKCSINVKICPCGEKAQKKVDPDQNEKVIKSASAAFRARMLGKNENGDENGAQGPGGDAGDREQAQGAEEVVEGQAQRTFSAAMQDDLDGEVIFL